MCSARELELESKLGVREGVRICCEDIFVRWTWCYRNGRLELATLRYQM
jgi:hypothetical protein